MASHDKLARPVRMTRSIFSRVICCATSFDRDVSGDEGPSAHTLILVLAEQHLAVRSHPASLRKEFRLTGRQACRPRMMFAL